MITGGLRTTNYLIPLIPLINSINWIINPGNLNSKIKYNRISAECRLAIRRYECWLESKIIDCNDIGAFYRFVNSKSYWRSDVGTLIGPDGKTVACDKEKADLLNSYFGSVCTVDDGLSPQIDASRIWGQLYLT